MSSPCSAVTLDRGWRRRPRPPRRRWPAARRGCRRSGRRSSVLASRRTSPGRGRRAAAAARSTSIVDGRLGDLGADVGEMTPATVWSFCRTSSAVRLQRGEILAVDPDHELVTGRGAGCRQPIIGVGGDLAAQARVVRARSTGSRRGCSRSRRRRRSSARSRWRSRRSPGRTRWPGPHGCRQPSRPAARSARRRPALVIRFVSERAVPGAACRRTTTLRSCAVGSVLPGRSSAIPGTARSASRPGRARRRPAAGRPTGRPARRGRVRPMPGRWQRGPDRPVPPIRGASRPARVSARPPPARDASRARAKVSTEARTSAPAGPVRSSSGTSASRVITVAIRQRRAPAGDHLDEQSGHRGLPVVPPLLEPGPQGDGVADRVVEDQRHGGREPEQRHGGQGVAARGRAPTARSSPRSRPTRGRPRRPARSGVRNPMTSARRTRPIKGRRVRRGAAPSPGSAPGW